MQQPSKALIGVAVLLSLIGAGCTADLNDSLNAGAPADEASQAAAAKPADLDRLLSAFGPGGGVPDIEPLDKYQNAEPGMVSVNLFNSRLSSTNATMEVLVIDPAESGGPFHDYLLLGSQAGGSSTACMLSRTCLQATISSRCRCAARPAASSAASPHVAAIASVLAALDRVPGGSVQAPTPAQIRTALIATRSSMSGDLSTIKRVNAEAAIATW
jgi:hypothetical protein